MHEYKFEEMTLEQITAKDIKALGDSVYVINQLVANPTLSQQDKRFLKANVDHISLMLSKEHIVAYTGDKTAFAAAVEAGTIKLT